MNLQQELIKATSEYFEDDIEFLNLSNASRAYKALLNAACGQNMDIAEGRSDIHFENGKALGTYWAALCLDDLMRTRQFIRGIDKAIKDKMKAKTPIHILYAGTGPYATLILPFILRYPKQDISYTFLEINPFSFQILQDLISKLGLEDYNIELVKDDATQYQIAADRQPDIIISETMQKALVKEQQVSIFLNLMHQAKPDTIFIPETIKLQVALKKAGIPAEEVCAEDYHKSETLFEVSKASMFSETLSTKATALTKKQTIIGNEITKPFDHLYLLTEIQVYGDERLGVNQSGLTVPIFLKDISNHKNSSVTIDSQYQISADPKLEYEVSLSEAT